MPWLNSNKHSNFYIVVLVRVTLWVGLLATIFFKAEKASKKDEFILSGAEGLQSLTQMLF